GLASATGAAGRAHRLTVFEAADAIGGQCNLARRIPGKEEFNETVRYFDDRLRRAGVELRLGTRADAAALAGFDHVVLATGVTPRAVTFPGAGHRNVVGYRDVLTGAVVVGQRVAIIGAGGIGVDVGSEARR